MRRFWLFTICGLLLAVAIPLLAAYCPRILLPSQCSPLYQRYCYTPGIEASYVKGFRINDTLFVDATLLHATDSASWATLLNDFHLVNAIDTSAYSRPHSFSILRVFPKDPTKRVSDPDEPFCSCVAFPFEKEIHIYSTENDDHRRALHMYLMLNLSKQLTSHKPTAAAAGRKKKGTPGAEPANKKRKTKTDPNPVPVPQAEGVPFQPLHI